MRMADYMRAKEELRAARIAMHLKMNYQDSMLRYRQLRWERVFWYEELRKMALERAAAKTLADFAFNNV